MVAGVGKLSWRRVWLFVWLGVREEEGRESDDGESKEGIILVGWVIYEVDGLMFIRESMW